MDISNILNKLDIVEKAALRPFKNWNKTHMIYPSGVPDKSFPEGYEGPDSRYVHPKSAEDAMWEATKLKAPAADKTSYLDPRTGYTHVKIEDLKKQLDMLIKQLEK